MKCEICKTIDKLGLDPAAHELWSCADSKSPRLALRRARVSIHHFCLEVTAVLQAKWRVASCFPYQRAHFLTLGL
jgi:hypothetical protein